MSRLVQIILIFISSILILGTFGYRSQDRQEPNINYNSNSFSENVTFSNQKVKVSYKIINENSGRLVPGKIMVMENGKPVDLKVPEQRKFVARRNLIHTVNGKGYFKVEPGEYNIFFGRGLEYSLDSKHIVLKAGRKYTITGRIKKVVKTPGYIGADMHLHTLTWSGHGNATEKQRVISCLGEGLDLVVATDHNNYVSPYPTDYNQIIKKLGMGNQLSAASGVEISTPHMGHFNVYPLDPREKFTISNDYNNAKSLFNSIRKSVGHSVVIQVNHPYWPGYDYFRAKGLNHQTGSISDPTWSWNFDAVEILNGHSNYDSFKKDAKHSVTTKEDWFKFLNNGRRITGVGDSDSHTIWKTFVGIPRTYIASTVDKPANIDENKIAENIKKHRVLVSRGLYIEFSTEKRGQIGSTAKTDEQGNISFHVKVKGAKWIDCDSVRIIKNARVYQTYEVAKSNKVVRFNKVITDMPDKNSWYIVVAKGDKPMDPMYRNMMPLAFTNPIWVDVNSNKDDI